MHDLLEAIVACARSTVEQRRRDTPLTRVIADAEARQPRGGLFHERVARPGAVNVIAECKRRSPAQGVLCRDYDPAAIAARYVSAGAAAISVLTEPSFFDGDLAHVTRVRDAVDVPVLRKDFVVDAYQMYEARAAGADAVLLIVAALARDEVCALVSLAHELGLAPLVEVHTDDDIEVALDAGASLVGVNSRNLRTLEVDLRVCHSLIARIPPRCVAVAESGMRTVDDVRRLSRAGYHAVLIGEWLMTDPDPAGLLRELSEGAAT
jgi:indole-3-glycerol phosphate synthase